MNNLMLDAKSRIVKATMEMLDEEKDIHKITVRRIAERANVGIGLINYHFQSKDRLLKDSVNIAMAEIADQWKNMADHDALEPVKKLKSMLKELSDFAVRYYKLTQISVSYELLHGNMETQQYLLPVLREIFDKEKDECSLRVIAFQIITNMQVILLQANVFLRYSGIDIFDEKQRDQLIDMLVDPLLYTV